MATKGALALNTVVDDILDNAYPTYSAANSVEYLAVGGGGAGGAAAGGGGGAGGFVTGTNLPITVSSFSYSAYLNGTNSYLQTAAYDATFAGDFTFECWAYITTYGTNSAFFTIGSEATGRYYFALQSSGQPWSNVYGGANFTWGTSTSVSLNQWNHIAWVRVGTTVTCYVNGVSLGTQTISGTVGNSGGVTLGANPAGGYLWTGYLSNVRLVNSALYTANFIPPTQLLTAITNTKLLTLGSSFDDSSTNNVVITKVGTPKISTRSPFESPIIVNVGVGGVGSGAAATLGGNGANTLVNSSWSGYFNGSTDYLTIPYNSAFDFPASTPLCFEAWVYTSSTSTFVMACRNWTFGGTGPTWAFHLSGGNNPQWGIAGTGSATYIMASSSISGNLNAWNHYAFTRDTSNVVRIFVNGVLGVSRTDSQAMTSASGSIFMGAPSNLANYSSGYMTNARLVVGSAVYTANFTPPTAPLIAIPDTKLLTLQNSTFKDNSSNTQIITKNGSAYPTTLTSPFEIKAFGGGGGGSNQNGTTQNGWASGGGDAGTGAAANRGSFGIYGQGTPGGTRISAGSLYGSGGGGGAGSSGGQGNATIGGNGGAGLYSTISGSNVAYAGGGGGQTYNSYFGSGYGGIGGGGDANIAVAGFGGMYLGSGGGGGGASDAGPAWGGYGGTGVVILRHPVTYDIIGRSANAIDVSYSSGYKIYTLRATDTVYFSNRPNVSTPNVASVSCLVIGGGGGGGSTIGGGGGAGGFVTFEDYLIMRGNTVTVTVGAGGLSDNASGAANAFVGTNSTFGDLISYGGGGGGSWANNPGYAGASGGGGSGGDGGFGLSSNNVAGQGSRGGQGGGPRVGGGGGGAGQYGFPGSTTSQKWSGNGGNGLISSITGTPTYYCGGGAGGVENSYTTHISTGGLGGGGNMGYSTIGVAGTINTGGGGGAGSNPGGSLNYGGSGGSGVVIISYATKYGLATSTTGSPAITTVNGNYVYKWTTTGSITF